MAKEKKAAWFKLYLHNKAVMQAVPNDVLGAAMKGIMDYFDEGVEPEMDPLTKVVFMSMRPFVDEANAQYEKDIESGKKSAQKRKEAKEAKSPSTPLNQKEEEKEKEKEEDEEEEKEEEKEIREKEEEEERVMIAAKPTRPRFTPPSESEVREYCNQMGYRFAPENFLNYYTSVGWKVGRNPMKDWKAALRNWNTKEKNYGKHTKHYEPEIPTWTIGVQL